MVWRRDGEKLFFENMITRFETVHKRDRQQDGTGRAYAPHHSAKTTAIGAVTVT